MLYKYNVLLGTITSFDNAYVELSQNQYRISKTNLGKQLTDEVHLNFSKVSSGLDYIFGEKSNGTKVKISKADLANVIRNDASALSGALECNRALYDGCYIMYHDQNDGLLLAVPYADWPRLQSGGEEADGVLIVEGGHSLLVAPKEKNCRWSSKKGTATNTVPETNKNRIALLDTWDGKDRTETICISESSPFSGDSSLYAPRYCYDYLIINSSGVSENMFWLPCVAELMMIYTHKQKINAGLALIRNSQQLSDGYYWSSTEAPSSNPRDSYAWGMNFNDGHFSIFSKINSSRAARPVSAYISKYPF